MQQFRIVAAVLGVLTLAAAVPIAGMARAQGAGCAPRDVIVARLAEGYGETRQAIGMAADDTAVEMFASLETGTWTIIVTPPRGGLTCMVASGYAYEAVAEAPAGKEL